MTPTQETENREARDALKPTLGGPMSAILILIGFFLLWLGFFELNRATPYIKNGADVVKLRKKEYELEGKTFPSSFAGVKLAVFGNSRVLAGYVPEFFDALAARDHIPVYSFNSGFPAQAEFVDELVLMTERGTAPDVVLLTIPWQSQSKGSAFFRLSNDDNQLADEIFPFRLYARNLARFTSDSVRYGGPIRLYKKEKAESESVLQARGYYFIKYLSKFPSDRLPANYTLSSDDPTHVHQRRADFGSAQLDRLNNALQKHNIRCFYIPGYLRPTEAAPAPAFNSEFANMLAQHSGCRVLGPDYFSYSPVLFSDESHLNKEGAVVYTEDIYKLVSPYLRGAN